MAPSTRKLYGTMILVVFLALYTIVMFIVGMAMAANTTSQLAAFAFYALAGLGWVVPAGWILKWMLAPVTPSRSAMHKERDPR